MRWIRSNTRFASCVALFALAVQFTLSFGHLHLDAHTNKAVPTISAGLGIISPASGEMPDRPAKHTKFADFCAICAVVHMASSSLIATPPSLLLPDSLSNQSVAVSFEAHLIALARSPSQPRAPPAA
jgi:hypothetical protein